jgi:hypothetical protein
LLSFATGDHAGMTFIPGRQSERWTFAGDHSRLMTISDWSSFAAGDLQGVDAP